ncbi:MAG: hypothetical protein H6703_00745 [Myxococcales bacterium]|nr:hypothetical protein [Myxococcales bacterium]
MRLLNRLLTATAALATFGLGLAHADEPAADAAITEACRITHTGNDFASNRHNGMPNGTLQVTVWYDGNAGKLTLKLQLKAPSGAMGFITIGAGFPGGSIEPFSTIETRQYTIGDCRLTGLAEVSGVVNNGAIDGLAFGLMAKYADGTYRVVKSIGQPSNKADFVGSWPISTDTNTFVQRATDLTNGFAREQGWMMLYGAQYLGNGKAEMQVR